MNCAYCGKRAIHKDHVLPRATLKRLEGKRKVPRWLFETTDACGTCNWLKGTRLLIPASWAGRLDELNALGIGVFRVWHGDRETLRTVAK